MLDLLYVAKLDFLAGLRRSLDDARPGDRFIPVDGRRDVPDPRREEPDRKAHGKVEEPRPTRP